jgi:nitrite reductase/ring-hydroxylating ferredoxin subunit
LIYGRLESLQHKNGPLQNSLKFRCGNQSVEQNRRSFLRNTLTGLALLIGAMASWGAARFSFFGVIGKRNREVSEQILQGLTDVPLHVPEARAWLRRNHDGVLIALDDRCPHLGCRQKWNPDRNRFECPCHGSEFDIDGNLQAGPATKAMPRLVVEPKDKEKIRLLEKS